MRSLRQTLGPSSSRQGHPFLLTLPARRESATQNSWAFYNLSMVVIELYPKPTISLKDVLYKLHWAAERPQDGSIILTPEEAQLVLAALKDDP